jgi:hypothetical protein
MSFRKLSIYFAASVLGAAAIGSSALATSSIVTYPMANGSEVPSTVSPDVTASNITFSSNATDFTGSGNSMGFRLLVQRKTEAAAAPDSYFQFTLTPNAEEAMDLTSLSFYDDYPNDPLSYVAVRSSLDGYTSDLLTTMIGLGSTATVTLGSPFASLTTPVTFELIGWNTNGDTGTITYYENLTVNGTTSAAPEPASLSLLGLGAAPLLGRRRRRV